MIEDSTAAEPHSSCKVHHIGHCQPETLQAMPARNDAFPEKESPRLHTDISQHDQEGLTSNAVTNVAEGDHATHNTQDLRIVWCSGLV